MTRSKAVTTPHSPRIRTATPSSVRAVNRSIILRLIRRRQPVSRADLARLTGIFRSSVSDIVDELISEGLVLEERAKPSQRGRVPMSLQLNELGHPVLGVNIRPAYSQIAFAGLSGRMQKTITFETPSSPRKLVEAIHRRVNRLQKFSRVEFQRLGIAIPGHVEASTGRIVWAPTHKELSGFPIADEVQKATGIAAAADNDCNAGALSELTLSAESLAGHSTDFVFLNVSDFGAGAGAMLDGEIYLGHDSRFAAEAGHMVIEPDGRPCTCGRRGCWERYVCNQATWKRFEPKKRFTVNGFEHMLEAAQNGNERAIEAIRETGRFLSLGISNLGFLFNPAKVVVAGRITAAWDLIAADLRRVYGSPHLEFEVQRARLSADDSLLHGAVCLALREVYAAPKFGEAPKWHNG